MGYAFISYSTKNQSFADATKKLFKDAGIDTWMAPYDIPPGSKYAEVINQAVKNCSCCVLLLSNDSQKSIWVGKEIERAINYKKTIIPVQIEDVELNDEFEFYISTNQIIAIRKIDKESNEIKNLLKSVASFTESKLSLEKDEPKHTSLDLQKDDEYNYQRAVKINEIFDKFRLDARIVSFKSGPTYTLFDIEMGENQTVRNIERIVPDIEIRLGIPSIRFTSFTNGKTTCGLEINNDKRENVDLKQFLSSIPFSSNYDLLVPFGKDVLNQFYYADLTKVPHMLIAGATGSGKSVFLHSLITSLITTRTPDEVRLMLIDPKRIELNPYKDIPHLLCPIINSSKDTYLKLNKLVDEMERRYDLFASSSTREIKEYNKYVDSKEDRLPYIVVIIDEYADLLDVDKEIRNPLIKLLQKSRAAGIHIVISTQRPSLNIIDGVIKANIPTRISFQAFSYIDSVTVLNEGGAEKLAGSGDMLILCPLFNRTFLVRAQGCYISLQDIKSVCEQLRKKYELHYNEAFLNINEDDIPKEPSPTPLTEEQLYEMVKADIQDREYCSLVYIQKTFNIGFARAGRIVKRLIDEGHLAETGDSRGYRVLKK